jgi:hypothetical protein
MERFSTMVKKVLEINFFSFPYIEELLQFSINNLFLRLTQIHYFDTFINFVTVNID